MNFLRVALIGILSISNSLVQKTKASITNIDEFISTFADQGFQSFHCLEPLTSMDIIYGHHSKDGRRHSIFFTKEYYQDKTNILIPKLLHKQVLEFKFFKPKGSHEIQFSSYLWREYRKKIIYLPFDLGPKWKMTFEKSSSKGILQYDQPHLPLLNSLHDSNNFKAYDKIPLSMMSQHKMENICPERHSSAYRNFMPLETRTTEDLNDVPINLIDYMADTWSEDGYFFQGMRNKNCLRPEWLGLLDALPVGLKPPEAYLNQLRSVKYENPVEEEPLLSFQITPSLQEIAPFLCAYGIPIGNGLLDVRNLIFVINGELRFAPNYKHFDDALRALHHLKLHGLIEIKKPIPTDLDKEYPEFFIKTKLPVNEIEYNHMGMAVEIPSSEIYTNPQQFLGVKWNYQNKSHQEKVLLPYINSYVVYFVTRYIYKGEEGRKTTAMDDLEDFGLPYLLEIWQDKL